MIDTSLIGIINGLSTFPLGDYGIAAPFVLIEYIVAAFVFMVLRLWSFAVVKVVVFFVFQMYILAKRSAYMSKGTDI